MRRSIIIFILTGSGLTLGLIFLLTSTPAPTFTSEIAPIVYENCTPCHRPDGPAPFSLITYEDLVAKAKTIRHVTGQRIMPPWPADTLYSRFVGERALTEDEISIIDTWVENGCEKGDPSMTPAPRSFPKGAFLGTPDLVIKMQRPFIIEGNNKDHFAVMKLPYEIPADTFIRAIEFVPEQKKLVHHVNGFLIQYEYEKKKNVFDGESFVNTEVYSLPEAYEMMDLANDDNTTFPLLTASVVNYLPGVWPTLYPEGIGGFRMKRKGHIFFKDIHYGPTPLDTADLSYVNIYFAPKPPERQILETQMGTLGSSPVVPPLLIPPNEIKKFTSRLQIPFDISILTVNPHMHLLGKSFLAYAVTPGSDTIPIIRINRWDFRWQYFYTFKKMVRIPAGSVIVTEGVFDNTSDNPLNPNKPPKAVGEKNGSMRTTDEMFQFIISYLPYREGDENISLESNLNKH